MNEKPKLNIDLAITKPILSEDNNAVFSEGVILREVSKFVTGTQENGVLPVPVFYDVKTGKVVISMLPKELRAEFEEYNKTKELA